MITVTDRKSGDKVKCLLTVKAPGGEFEIISTRYKVSAAVPDAIEAELKNPPYPIGTIYEIIYSATSEDAGRWVVKGTDRKEIASGDFTYVMTFYEPDVYYLLFPKDGIISSCVRLSIKLDGKQLAYDMYCITVGGAVQISSNYYFYEDLTEYYKAKYPDAGVSGVVRVQIRERRE